MAIGYSTSLRNTRLDAITTAIGTSGLCRIYSGTRPATVNTALSGNTLLAELPASSSFAAAASGGVLTANAFTADSSADATGTATWATFTTSGGTRVADYNVGTSGSDLNLNTTAISAGAQVSITSFTITHA